MKILVAGIGNIFHGDDAFGCEVIHQLNRVSFPDSVTVRDFGIRSYDLAYALADGYDVKILVDALPQKSAPGTVVLMEPDLAHLEHMESTEMDAHSMNPIAALQMARSAGPLRGKFYLVGCEPAVLEDETGEMALSQPVRDAVPKAVNTICHLVATELAGLETPTALESNAKE
jgi:hydrogenase maturation protease